MWKDVLYWDNYIVSDQGEIARKDTGELLKQYKQRNGYVYVYLNRGNGNCAEISIPLGLAKQLNYCMNKSKGISIFNRYKMFAAMRQKMLEVLEIFIQKRVSLLESSNAKKATQYNCKLTTNKNKNDVNFTARAMKDISRSNFCRKEEDSIVYNLSSKICQDAIGENGSMAKFKGIADVSSLIYIWLLKMLLKKLVLNSHI